MLSTFKLWLELNRMCKGKTLLGVVKKLFVFSSIINWSKAKHGFLSSLAEWAQKFKFLYTTGSWKDSTYLNPLDFTRRKLLYIPWNVGTEHRGHKSWAQMLTNGIKAVCQEAWPPTLSLVNNNRDLRPGPRRKSSAKVRGRGYVLAISAACWEPLLCSEIFKIAIWRRP